MINRLFNIKKDFHNLNELENEIMPIIDKAKFNRFRDKVLIKDYIRKIFNNQWRLKND